jgi:sulfur relay protein TusB/DsrH
MPKSAFIVLKSPQEIDPSHTIKRFAGREEASAILIEDGVYQALVDGHADKLKEAAHEILVSKEDLLARGFGPADLKIGDAVDYADIVDCIMERTERTITV